MTLLKGITIMVMPDLKMAMAMMAITAIMTHYGYYGYSHFQVYHDQDLYPLKEYQKAYSLVKRSCQFGIAKGTIHQKL